MLKIKQWFTPILMGMLISLVFVGQAAAQEPDSSRSNNNSAGSPPGILECPSSPPSTSDPQWKPYDGNSKVFHCGFTGIVENRTPTPENPAQECFYDNSGTLVDEHHACAGCRGTPNQYPASDWWNHTFNDSGGIGAKGQTAYSESKRCNSLQQTPSSWDNAP